MASFHFLLYFKFSKGYKEGPPTKKKRPFPESITQNGECHPYPACFSLPLSNLRLKAATFLCFLLLLKYGLVKITQNSKTVPSPSISHTTNPHNIKTTAYNFFCLDPIPSGLSVLCGAFIRFHIIC